jgi:hypothetical protein
MIQAPKGGRGDMKGDKLGHESHFWSKIQIKWDQPELIYWTSNKFDLRRTTKFVQNHDLVIC